MKKTRLLFLAFLFVLILFPTNVKAENDLVTVRFTDNNLFVSVKEQLTGKIYSVNPSQKSITMTNENLLSVNSLSLSNKNITYLSGLDKFKNLTVLNLSNNNVISILPLSYLTNLTSLSISYNNISYITPIKSLSKLTFLNMEGNKISDVSAIGTLSELRVLDLNKNSIRDISSFKNLTDLVTLCLEENKVEDVSCLNSLSKLKNISLKKQNYEYTINGNVLSNIKTNINLPTFFVQAKNKNYCNYTSTNLELSKGLSLGSTSKYIVLQNTVSGQRTSTVKIVGGNADGSTMVLKYNNIVVKAGESSSEPSKIYERVGGTLSCIVAADGETSTDLLSLAIIKNNNAVTNQFEISKSTITSTIAKFTIKVPKTITAGTYNIRILYNGKVAQTGKFTIYDNPSVSSIKLNTTTLKLKLGQSYKLNTTIYPTTVINKEVTWTSSAPSVVNVDSNGNITAKAPGTAIITAKAKDGGKTVSCTVEVTSPVTGITLNVNKATLLLNESRQLTAKIVPENATNQTIIWQSSNPNVVSVNGYGVITGKASGKATIKAITVEGNFSASCLVTVEIPVIKPQVVPVKSISINKASLTLVEGKSETLLATILPDNASNKAFTWDSINPNIASVDSNGVVTAKSVGTTKIIVNALDNSLGTKQAICQVTVIADNTKPQVVPVKSISINKASLTLVEGKSETLLATILPDNASNKAFTWDSINPNIASVDSNGVVTAKSVGTTKIIVNALDNSLGTKQAICQVTVIASNITSSTYEIENNIIRNIPANCKLNKMISNLSIPLSYKFYNVNGKEVIYNDVVCTGMYIELENGIRYFLVVNGDVSGDGKISVTDVLLLKRHMVSLSKLGGVYNFAADLNNSGTITLTDLLAMKKVIVGLK